MLLALGVALLAVTVQVPAKGQEDPLVILGTFTPTVTPPNHTGTNYGGEVYLFPEPATRKLFSVGQGDNWLVAYDLDTFQPLGGGVRTSQTASMTSTLADTDGSLYIGFAGQPHEAPILERFVLGPAGMQSAGKTVLSGLVGRMPYGLYRAPRSSQLWILSVAVDYTGQTRPYGLMVTQVDLAKFGTPQAVEWDKALPPEQCPWPVKTSAEHFPNTAIGHVNGALVFGCASPRYPFSPTNVPGPPMVRGAGKLSLVKAADGSLDPGEFRVFPGPADFASGNAFFDPLSGRLALVGHSAATNGASAFVFDGVHDRFVGSVAIHQNQPNGFAMGLDRVTGRFYAVAPNGITGADIRSNPPSQGYRAADLGRDPAQPGKDVLSGFGVAADPVTGRLFVAYSSGTIYVMKDRVPPFDPAAVGDVDANTRDVEEAPGKTEATYAGVVQGYGASYRWIGGLQSVVANAITIDASSTQVSSGTRELRSSYLQRMSVRNSEAAASVITAMPDEGDTSGDLSRTQPHDHEGNPIFVPSPENPDEQTQIPQLVNWPYQAANCSDFGEKRTEGQATDAETSCDADIPRATANSITRSTEVNQLAVGKAELRSRSYVDDLAGTVAEITSVARGVNVLGGQLQVGEVTTRARASAKGRPGTTKAKREVEVKDVFLEGRRLCSDDCDLDALAREINGRLVGRVQVSFPKAEVFTSKGGYQASVQLQPFHHMEEVALNERSTDRVEVPAMVITVLAENVKPNRIVLSLAAVAVEANYGIGLIGSGEDETDGTETGALADSLGGPIFGAAPNVNDNGGAGFGGSPRRIGGGGDGGVASQAGKFIMNGVRLFGQLLPIWAVLLIPIYLSARRWLLLQRATLLSRSSS